MPLCFQSFADYLFGSDAFLWMDIGQLHWFAAALITASYLLVGRMLLALSALLISRCNVVTAAT